MEREKEREYERWLCLGVLVSGASRSSPTPEIKNIDFREKNFGGEDERY